MPLRAFFFEGWEVWSPPSPLGLLPSRALSLCFVSSRKRFLPFDRWATCCLRLGPEISLFGHLHLATSTRAYTSNFQLPWISFRLNRASTEPASHTPFLFRPGADQVQRHNSSSARGTSSPTPTARPARCKLRKVANALPAHRYPLLLPHSSSSGPTPILAPLAPWYREDSVIADTTSPRTLSNIAYWLLVPRCGANVGHFGPIRTCQVPAVSSNCIFPFSNDSGIDTFVPPALIENILRREAGTSISTEPHPRPGLTCKSFRLSTARQPRNQPPTPAPSFNPPFSLPASPLATPSRARIVRAKSSRYSFDNAGQSYRRPSGRIEAAKL